MTKLVRNIYQKSLREMKQYYNNVQLSVRVAGTMSMNKQTFRHENIYLYF